MTAAKPAPAHGRPTAAELVAAVAEFLESDVRGATEGQVNFHARVAANVLRTVQRELTHAGLDGTAAALADLDVGDEAELAAAIRAGRLDGRAGDVLPALRRLVRDRLTVAHPGYAITSIADRLFAALEAGDAEAVAAMWAPEIAVWQVGAPRPNDKARARRVIDWFLSASADRRYDVLVRRLFEDGFVQQHVLHGRCRDGTPYSLRVAIIVVVGADGLITRIDEYFDPATLAPLLDQHVPASRR